VEIGREDQIPLQMSTAARPAPAGTADLAEVETRLVLPAEVQEQLKRSSASNHR